MPEPLPIESTASPTIPALLQPYVSSLLTNTAALTNPTLNPYAGLGSYYSATGETPFAQINPLQRQAATSASALGPSSYLGQSASLASNVANQASQYGQLGNFYNAPQAQSMGFNYLSATAPSLQNYQMANPQQVSMPSLQQYQMAGPERVSGPTNLQSYQMGPVQQVSSGLNNLQQYQMGPAQQVGADRFTTQAMYDYMSPYMSGVVEQQKRAAIQDYARQIPGLQAAGIRAGARGGTREALVQSEAQRNLQNQLGSIEASGRQQAFEQASQQFGQDRAALMQAALANQQAGLTTDQQNLAARLGVQQLGAQNSLQAALANQQAGLTAEQQNLAARLGVQQLGAQTGLQAALANQQAGLTTGQQNLAAQLGVQQLGTQSGLQAALANQQAGLTAGQTNLNALLGIQSLGAQQNMQAQQMNQSAQQQMQQMQLSQLQGLNQYGLTNANNLAQYGMAGADYGLRALQQQLAASQQLGTLGNYDYNQMLGAINQQSMLGQNLYGIESDVAKAQFADYQAMMNDPLAKLGIYSGILRNVPVAQQSYSGPMQSSTAGDITALLGGLGGFYNDIFGTP